MQKSIDRPRLTREEARNGWTESRLAQYLAEREAQQVEYALRLSRQKPAATIVNVDQFNPHRW